MRSSISLPTVVFALIAIAIATMPAGAETTETSVALERLNTTVNCTEKDFATCKRLRKQCLCRWENRQCNDYLEHYRQRDRNKILNGEKAYCESVSNKKECMQVLELPATFSSDAICSWDSNSATCKLRKDCFARITRCACEEHVGCYWSPLFEDYGPDPDDGTCRRRIDNCSSYPTEDECRFPMLSDCYWDSASNECVGKYGKPKAPTTTAEAEVEPQLKNPGMKHSESQKLGDAAADWGKKRLIAEEAFQEVAFGDGSAKANDESEMTVKSRKVPGLVAGVMFVHAVAILAILSCCCCSSRSESRNLLLHPKTKWAMPCRAGCARVGCWSSPGTLVIVGTLVSVTQYCMHHAYKCLIFNTSPIWTRLLWASGVSSFALAVAFLLWVCHKYDKHKLHIVALLAGLGGLLALTAGILDAIALYWLNFWGQEPTRESLENSGHETEWIEEMMEQQRMGFWMAMPVVACLIWTVVQLVLFGAVARERWHNGGHKQEGCREEPVFRQHLAEDHNP